MKRLINTTVTPTGHKTVRIAKPRNPIFAMLLIKSQRAGKHGKTNKQQRAAKRSHGDTL